jgi:organizing structure protein 2
VAPLAATIVIAGMALGPKTVHAEAPSKKPIYDDFELLPTTTNVTIISPPSTVAQAVAAPAADEETSRPRRPAPTDRLAVQIGRARMFLHKHTVKAEDAINSAMDRAFSLEQSFTSTIASLAPPKESGEKLMPGAVYVLVAAMAGSIVARNRNIFVRASLPIAFGVGAGWVVLPITMRNVGDLTWRYEQRFPAAASTHLMVRESIEKGWSFAKTHKDVGVRMVDEKVTGAREAVEGWVRKGK